MFDKKGKTTTTVIIDEDIYQKLRFYCVEHRMSMRHFINSAIKEKLGE